MGLDTKTNAALSLYYVFRRLSHKIKYLFMFNLSRVLGGELEYTKFISKAYIETSTLSSVVLFTNTMLNLMNSRGQITSTKHILLAVDSRSWVIFQIDLMSRY